MATCVHLRMMGGKPGFLNVHEIFIVPLLGSAFCSKMVTIEYEFKDEAY
jgi:hypothetical protein